MHGRRFCMRWIIRGWPGPSTDGLGPRLALNTARPSTDLRLALNTARPSTDPRLALNTARPSTDPRLALNTARPFTDPRLARFCQASHGCQAIRGWPGSATGPEQMPTQDGTGFFLSGTGHPVCIGCTEQTTSCNTSRRAVGILIPDVDIHLG